MIGMSRQEMHGEASVEGAPMNATMKLSVLIGLVFLLGAAGVRASLAQATTTTTRTTLTRSGTANCGMEDVEVSGPIDVVTHVTIDANGGMHGHTTFDFSQLRGVGLTSGNTYQSSGKESHRDSAGAG
jgi:hypothetical protein